jgi:hypothetical protein
MPELRGLDVAADPATWAGLGFTVTDGVCAIDGVAVRLGADGKLITAWTVEGIAPGTDVDGLASTAGAPAEEGARHPNGSVTIDHLVVLSPQPARTIAALAAHDIEVRGERHTDQYGAPYTQTFFRLGRPILELIGPDTPTDDGPARFFGLAVTVADLDATAEFFGDRLGRVKEAVQPGRRIATLRRDAGAALPLAFMSGGASAVDLHAPRGSGT